MAAHFRLFTGPMFSGKTERLILAASQEPYARRPTLVIKPVIDDRYHPTRIMGHRGTSMQCFPVSDPRDIAVLVKQHAAETVAIDEIQFFGGAVVPVVDDLLNSGVNVIAAGLNLNFKRETFGPMGDLLARADDVITLHAYCDKCGTPTNLTYRKSQDTAEVLVGSDMYEPRCRSCWNRQ